MYVLEEDLDVLIGRWHRGDRRALSLIFSSSYDQLLNSARYLLSTEERRLYQPTELVHEAFLELAQRSGKAVQDRQHFFRYTLRCMRHFLMGRARSRNTSRRGGGHEGLPIDEVVEWVDRHSDIEQRINLQHLLDHMRQHDDRQWRIVDLHCRCGCTFAEIGIVLGLSERTVKRQWRAATDWMRQQASIAA